MTAANAIAIFAGNGAEAAYLGEIVRLAGFEPVDASMGRASLIIASARGRVPPDNTLPVVRVGGPAQAEGVRVLEPPVRAAGLIDVLQKTMRALRDFPPRIGISGCVLDTRENLWLCEGDAPVRLTEKETAILAYMKAAGGKAVTREQLLENVWSYVRDVETHTLETHIYRLRQKIEKDPSAPKILITQGDGYILAAD